MRFDTITKLDTLSNTFCCLTISITFRNVIIAILTMITLFIIFGAFMTMFNCTFTFPFSINNKVIVTFYTFVFSITIFTIIYITGWQAIQLFSTSIINVFGFFKACFTLSTRITFSMCTVIFIH